MEFLKDKYFFWGIITGFLWTAFGMFFLLFIFSDGPVEESFSRLYEQKKLGGLISLAALINLPVFFVALRKNKFSFATGLIAISLLLVIVIALLKLNFKS